MHDKSALTHFTSLCCFRTFFFFATPAWGSNTLEFGLKQSLYTTDPSQTYNARWAVSHRGRLLKFSHTYDNCLSQPTYAEPYNGGPYAMSNARCGEPRGTYWGCAEGRYSGLHSFETRGPAFKGVAKGVFDSLPLDTDFQ